MICLAATLIADEPAAKKPAAAPAASKADADPLARFKALAGAWETSDEDGDGKPDTQVFYRVVSGGTAVAEFLMPGTEHEMVSMYHQDGDSLMMTHYCAIGNQPRMRARAGADAKQVVFEFADGTNMKSRDEMHIDGLHLTFVDDDHLIAAWKTYRDGKAGDGPTFKFARVKDAAAAAKIASLVASPSQSLTPYKANDKRE